MADSWSDESDYPGRDEQGPEADAYRELSDEERAREKTVEELLTSLGPQDAMFPCWSWKQIQRYALKRIRRRRG
jgi:hypothetical protein